MSRIGRMPIQVPSSVKVVLDQQDVAVEGPKGRLSRVIPEGIKIGLADGVITIERLSNQKLHRSLHGLIRSLVANMVVGVTEGFEKKLLLVGTGYRAEVDRQSRLVLNVGYSHSVIYPPPDGITLNTGDSETVSGQPYIPITVSGIDRQLVGQVAASIRQIKKPDVYEPCKGIRYEGERVRMKEGKTGV